MWSTQMQPQVDFNIYLIFAQVNTFLLALAGRNIAMNQGMDECGFDVWIHEHCIMHHAVISHCFLNCLPFHVWQFTHLGVVGIHHFSGHFTPYRPGCIWSILENNVSNWLNKFVMDQFSSHNFRLVIIYFHDASEFKVEGCGAELQHCLPMGMWEVGVIPGTNRLISSWNCLLEGWIRGFQLY